MKINPQTNGKPVIRCSGLDRLLHCHGSRTLEQRLKDFVDGLMDFSDGLDGDAMTWRGNWCHWDSARRLVQDHGAIAVDGLDAPVLPANWQPTPWDERTSQWYVDNVVELTPPDHAIYVERRFTIEFPRFVLTGQLDTYTVNPDVTEFTIDDDKTGPSEVDHAELNWQLTGYAVLLKKALPTLKKGKLRILQKEAENPITEVEVDQLDGLSDYLENAINAALDARLELQTGYKACRLCPCIEFCPALRKEIEAMKHLLTEEELAALVVTPDRRQLAEVAVRGRAIAGPIARLLKTLKERVELEGSVVLADGTSVRVIEENGRREVTAPKVAFAFVSQKFGDDDVAWKTMSMSLGTLEDELVEAGMQRKSVKPEKETAQSWIKKTLGHLIVQKKQKELKIS